MVTRHVGGEGATPQLHTDEPMGLWPDLLTPSYGMSRVMEERTRTNPGPPPTPSSGLSFQLRQAGYEQRYQQISLPGIGISTGERRHEQAETIYGVVRDDTS